MHPKPSAETKARYPLREAKIEVKEVPGSPGTYNAEGTLSADGWEPGIAIPFEVSGGPGAFSGSMVIDETGHGQETHIAYAAGSYTFATTYDETILPGHNAVPVTFTVTP